MTDTYEHQHHLIECDATLSRIRGAIVKMNRANAELFTLIRTLGDIIADDQYPAHADTCKQCKKNDCEREESTQYHDIARLQVQLRWQREQAKRASDSINAIERVHYAMMGDVDKGMRRERKKDF